MGDSSADDNNGTEDGTLCGTESRALDIHEQVPEHIAGLRSLVLAVEVPIDSLDLLRRAWRGHRHAKRSWPRLGRG
jgi:hypothetical protein